MEEVKKDPGFEFPKDYLNPYQTWEMKIESDLMGIDLREIMEPVTAILEQICRMLLGDKRLAHVRDNDAKIRNYRGPNQCIVLSELQKQSHDCGQSIQRRLPG